MDCTHGEVKERKTEHLLYCLLYYIVRHFAFYSFEKTTYKEQKNYN